MKKDLKALEEELQSLRISFKMKWASIDGLKLTLGKLDPENMKMAIDKLTKIITSAEMETVPLEGKIKALEAQIEQLKNELEVNEAELKQQKVEQYLTRTWVDLAKPLSPEIQKELAGIFKQSSSTSTRNAVPASSADKWVPLEEAKKLVLEFLKTEKQADTNVIAKSVFPDPKFSRAKKRALRGLKELEKEGKIILVTPYEWWFPGVWKIKETANG
jgi:polyhydroxyalkanoate synthesis regulator phasin